MPPIALPVNGAANNSTYKAKGATFAPAPNLRNVWLFNAETDRPQMGKRPGLARVFAQRLGTGPIQGMAAVARASVVTGYTIGECVAETGGTSLESLALSGNHWLLDSVPSMIRSGYLDVTGEGGPATNVVNAAAAKPTLTPSGLCLYAVSSNYTVGGLVRARIAIIRADTGQTVASYVISDSAEHRYINSLHWGGTHLYAFGSGFLWVFSVTDTAITLLGANNANGWAEEMVAGGTYTAGGIEYLYAAYNGSTAGTSVVAPTPFTIQAGEPALQFRAAVAKYRVSASGIAQIDYGQTIDGTGFPSDWGSGYFESYHQAFRFSTHSRQAPRGCRVQGLRVRSDGSVYVIRSNTGYGPNSSISPDISESGRVSVCRISDGGRMLWESDVGSIVALGMGGFYNDLLDPTMQALAVDAAGNCYVAGRPTAANENVWRLSAGDGSVVWATTLSAAAGRIREAAAVVDPTDESPVFGGDRNTVWTGSGGAAAHLWKLDPVSGLVTWSFDLGSGVSALAVAVTAQGEIVYGTDKV